MLLKYFDLYTGIGMQIIPVYRDSKIPVGKKWNIQWNRDKSREMIATGKYNIGLLLGEIVDVEGDTEEANEFLTKLIGNVPHPMYRSSRSVHHLFLTVDPDLTSTRFQDIEFRGRLHQSVLPPSTHENGADYKWLRGSVLQPPTMPNALREFYFANKRVKPQRKFVPKKQLPHGLMKTVCKSCNCVEIIHKKRLMLEVRAFAENKLPWMCHECRELDVRDACRRIRNTLEQSELVISE